MNIFQKCAPSLSRLTKTERLHLNTAVSHYLKRGFSMDAAAGFAVALWGSRPVQGRHTMAAALRRLDHIRDGTADSAVLFASGLGWSPTAIKARELWLSGWRRERIARHLADGDCKNPCIVWGTHPLYPA